MKLLMLSGDTDAARGRDGAFSAMLQHFSGYWDRIDVICPKAKNAEPRTLYDNVFLHPSPLPSIAQPLHIIRKGRQLLYQHNHDAVISHDYGWFYNGIGAWLLTGGSDIPVISEIHHIEGHPFALTRRELLYRGIAKFYLRRSWQRLTAIRVVNRFEVPEFLEALGVPTEKIHYLPSMYLDFSTFRPQPNTEKLYDLLFVGRFVSNKGILTILDAAAMVKAEGYPDLKLCLLGEGNMQAEIEQHIIELDLSNNVTIKPRVPTMQDLATLYNQAKLLVCASTSEGGPRVTVEAMACGTAVISTPVGIMKDLMQDGKNFMVFGWHAQPLAEKIKLLLDTPFLRQQLAENGEIAVQGFRAETIIDQYARAYQAIIQGE